MNQINALRRRIGRVAMVGGIGLGAVVGMAPAPVAAEPPPDPPVVTISIDEVVQGGSAQFGDFSFEITEVAYLGEDPFAGCCVDLADLVQVGEPMTGSDPDVEVYWNEPDVSLVVQPAAETDILMPASLFRVRELPFAGYEGSFECESLQSWWQLSDGSVLLEAYAGDEVNCVAYNNAKQPDLQLTKSVSNSTPFAGTSVDYTLIVTNVGGEGGFSCRCVSPSAVPMIVSGSTTVVDTLPDGLLWTAVPAECTGAGTTSIECTIDNEQFAGAGDSVTLVATAAIAADAQSGTYTNIATVDASFDEPCVPVREVVEFGYVDPCAALVCGGKWEDSRPRVAFDPADPANNVACVDITVGRSAAITLSKTDNVETAVHPGDSFAYTLQVGNSGPSSIYGGARVTDDLPDGVSLVSVEGGSGWTCNAADPVVCDYAPSIAPGGGATPVVVGVALATSYVPNSVVNTADVVGTYDFEGGLLTAQAEAAGVAETTVAAASETTVVAHTSNLGVTKTASATSVPAGGNVVWTITAGNAGPDMALGVTVVDNVPGPLVVVSATSNEFSCAVAGNVVTCTKATLAVGETGTILVTTMVPAGTATQSFTNGVTIGQVGSDPVVSNNAGEQMVMVGSEAVAPTVPTAPTAPTGGVLPSTGSNQEPLMLAALIALGGGVALSVLRRRRPVATR